MTGITLQQIFDHGWQTFVVENQPLSGEIREDEDGTERLQCQYRGPNVLKCLIGHFIPDDVYSPEMENLPFYQIRDRFSKDFFNVDLRVVAEAQYHLHDKFSSLSYNRKKEYEKFAQKYNLRIPS